MKLRSFRVVNYKSFNDSDSVRLHPHMNVITGQNNAGKTSLLQALELSFFWAGHRSMTTFPVRGEYFSPPSQVEITICLSGEELSEILRTIREVRMLIPRDPNGGPHPLGLPYDGHYQSAQNMKAIWDWFCSRAEIEFKLMRVVEANGQVTIKPMEVPSHDLFSYNPQDSRSPITLVRQLDAEGKSQFTINVGSESDLGVFLFGAFQQRIYRFHAERFGLGESGFGTNAVLSPNASNLAEALNTLQSNATRFEKYVSHVQYVLPQVRWISVEPFHNGTLQTKIWCIAKDSERNDLAIPLTESGTGIGQVLSIIYVAFTSERSRVFLIDEPQSFLHPGAARKLIEVLLQFSQHQFIISTHSPAVIATAKPEAFLVVRNEEGQSKIEATQLTDTQALQSFLDEIGASLSDVFGMDRVLWVEGRTEELALPWLVEKLGIHLGATAIVGIRNTGDLESKDARKILEIYNNLTGKASLLPPSVMFMLDSETRSPEQKRELESIGKGHVRFLPQRNFENYLIHAKALYEVTSSIKGFVLSRALREQDVQNQLDALIQSPKYWRPEVLPEPGETDLKKINGALVLHDLFEILSEKRVSYQKTTHSVKIFKWILDNDLRALDELVSFVRPLLEGAP